MDVDIETISTIKSINWFANCGAKFTTKSNLDLLQVKNWAEAKLYYENPRWEETTLAARNELTSYLHKKCSGKYNDWNNLTGKAKVFLQEEIIPIIAQFEQQNKLNAVFIDCVRWDLLGVLMEKSYKECKPPKFYSLLLSIYIEGHFPCGWDGLWPNGKLVVL